MHNVFTLSAIVLAAAMLATPTHGSVLVAKKAYEVVWREFEEVGASAARTAIRKEEANKKARTIHFSVAAASAVGVMPKESRPVGCNFDWAEAQRQERQEELTRLKEIREDDRAARAYQLAVGIKMIGVRAVRKAWADDMARKNSPEMQAWWAAHNKMEAKKAYLAQKQAKRKANKALKKAKNTVSAEGLLEQLLWEAYKQAPIQRVVKPKPKTAGKKAKAPKVKAETLVLTLLKEAKKVLKPVSKGFYTPEYRAKTLEARALHKAYRDAKLLGIFSDEMLQAKAWLTGTVSAADQDRVVIQRSWANYQLALAARKEA